MIVFTNGCFDLIHPGHIDLLTKARELGSKLIVGINSDRSVRAIKGKGRPFQNEEARRTVLLGLKPVDEVMVFDELTPERVIREIKPDVLVKGGDWGPGEIIGADFVESYGGRVCSIPLLEGYSTTAIASSFEAGIKANDEYPRDLLTRTLQEHLTVLQAVGDGCAEQVQSCADLLVQTIRNGRKVLLCGNGGSAADAQHIAAEFVGRYETERRALAAIALTTDTSALTALANDYNFDRIFARQVEALGNEGDCLVAISTSGSSPNVIAAVMKARENGMTVLGMTGAGGKKLAGLCDACFMAPSKRTARIQEAHITIAHLWCEIIDVEVGKE